MEKLWAGRSDGKQVDGLANTFNASIAFDQRMVHQDIEGSLAHAKMLSETGILSADDGAAIAEALAGMQRELLEGTLRVDLTSEDVHSFVELELTKRIGDAGKRLHTARSRNDQVALDLRLYIHAETDQLISLLQRLILSLTDKAEEHQDTVMPGYTHLQPAQPVTLAQHLLAYVFMLFRDAERFQDGKKRLLQMPLGAGALAGTTYPIDRDMVRETLSFLSVSENSMDAVSDRDFVLETAFFAALTMAHLSRLAEELIIWSTMEFRFIRLSDAYSTGSSIMPQKKNPDIAELIRGKTARMYGNLMALFTLIKALPLAYNKDLQEDKPLVFDAIDTLKQALELMEGMIRTMEVDRDRMRAAAKRGYLNATDCADFLAKKGMPFRDAYRVTGKLVLYAEQKEKGLEDLTISEFRSFSPLFSEEIYAAISLSNCVNARSSAGGTSKESTQKQIDLVRRRLKDGTHLC